jgi:endonuclease-3 related protein
MANHTSISSDITKIYQALLDQFGPQKWWPGDTAFEVIVGAVLTQNTNWKNVEKAIVNLKREGLLSIEQLHKVSLERLAQAIKPAGYFNVKAKRLKNVVAFIMKRYPDAGTRLSLNRRRKAFRSGFRPVEACNDGFQSTGLHDGSLDVFNQQSLDHLRRELLSINGVGPETADSILLYAFDKPAFVVDAYTKRFLTRHNMVSAEVGYQEVQKIFLDALDLDVKLFNEYHALIVKVGKDFCKPHPKCEDCPLQNIRYNRNNRCENCYRSFLDGEKKYFSRNKIRKLVCRGCRKKFETFATSGKGKVSGK